jgi:CubicO group peptidase (beta-lactamase class C family)
VTTAADEVIAATAPALEARVGAYRRENRLPGIMAGIATPDGLRWSCASGFADIEAARRPDERTLYRVASITKTFTATAVLQLRDEGRFRLDDPAVRFLPELARIADPHGPIEDLTIRRLLMHSSGLQGEVPWQDNEQFWVYRPGELPGVMHLGAVRTPPETDHKYSNFAFEILGLLIERVSGRSWPDYIRAEILDPLGLRDTTHDPDADPDLAARRAVGYDARLHDDIPARARAMDEETFLADGGLWSSARDLGLWLGQQLRADPAVERGEGQVLAGRTLVEMHRPRIVAKADWSQAQGLCWYGTREGETILVGHSGSLYGFQTNISFSVPGKIGAVVLLNGIGNAPKLARELIAALLPALREAEDRAEVPRFVPVPDAYRELLGAYRDPEFGDDTLVEWRDGKLVLRYDDPKEPVHELVATDDPLAFIILGGRPGGEAMVFGRAADGRIDRANAAGYPLIRVALLRDPAP